MRVVRANSEARSKWKFDLCLASDRRISIEHFNFFPRQEFSAADYASSPVRVLLREVSMVTILSVGEDFDLLKTRAQVLRKTGANVLCSSAASALKFIAEWEFDLIVLCHSVCRRDALPITESAHARGSKTLVLLLVSEAAGEQQDAGIDYDAKTFVEPDCLIRSISELLNRQTRYSPAKMFADGQSKSSPRRKRPESCPSDIAARRALLIRFGHLRAS
jgi:DNA-binding response OmpR family regulator